MRVETAAGAVIDLGTTEATPTISIVDFSRRVTDDFGVTTVVKRGFARRLAVRLSLPFDQVDAVQARLADLRATSALWVADDRFAWLKVEGFYKDFDLDLSVPPTSFCRLTIEGLAESEVVADPGGDPAPTGQVSSLRVIQPVEAAGLLSSNVPETDYPEWSATTTYGARARVIKAATHRIYESVIAANTDHDPAALEDKWIDVGPTNRWAMLDQSLGTATTANGSIVVQVPAAAALALLDVSAATVRVQATGYDKTQGVSGSTITFLDLPKNGGPITVTVSGAGQVAVGTLVAGSIAQLGVTESSPTAAITDYSRKETDDFGGVTVVERAWAKRMTTKALFRTDEIDRVANRIAAVRGRPALWIGQAGLDTLTIYGFFKEFSIEVGDAVSKLSLSIEGLSKAAPLAPVAQEPGINWVGDWSADQSYRFGAVARFDGRTFTSLIDHNLGHEPPTTSIDSPEWAYLSSQILEWQEIANRPSDLFELDPAAATDLAQIGSDNWLHPAEKLIVQQRYAQLLGEQSGILGQAAALGASSTSYSSELNKLTAYLDALLPRWDDTSAPTAIVRATWDQNWTEVFNARQALLNDLDAKTAAAIDLITLPSLGYFGSPYATQNADGANMIPSPYALDRVELGGAGTYINDATSTTPGRQLYFGRRAVLQAKNSYVMWEAGATVISVLPGETLYAAFAVAHGGGITTDTVSGIVQWFASNGDLVSEVGVSSSIVTGAQITAAGGAAPAVVAHGSVTVPNNAAFCRFYVTRQEAAQGGYFIVSEPYLGRQEQGATVTTGIAGEASIYVVYSSTGQPQDGQLPFLSNYKLFRNGVQITSGVTWAVTTVSGTAIASISGDGTGILSVESVPTSSTLRIVATFQGLAAPPAEVIVTRTAAPAPPPSGQATSVASSDISMSSTMTYGDANSPVMRVRTGSNGAVTFSGDLDFYLQGAIGGSSSCAMKWLIATVGGTYADVGTETGSDYPAVNSYDSEAKATDYAPGHLSVIASKTGLAANTEYDVFLDIRNVTNTRRLSFNGEVRATGS